MDTRDVAEHLGTTPRVLRQFLRSPISTFAAVGSGGRYDFSTADMATLEKRFVQWRGESKAKVTTPVRAIPSTAEKLKAQRERDLAEWEDEGPVELEDIRDPRVRARVRAAARMAEDQLMMLLMAKGMHITQLGDRQAS